MPDRLNKGDYLKLDFQGADEFPLEPHRTYAFLLMFLDRAPQRSLTLANQYYGTHTPDPKNKLCGHGIRREGTPAFPDDWKSRLAQPPGTLGFPDACTFRDLHFAVTVVRARDGSQDRPRLSADAGGFQPSPTRLRGASTARLGSAGGTTTRR